MRSLLYLNYSRVYDIFYYIVSFVGLGDCQTIASSIDCLPNLQQYLFMHISVHHTYIKSYTFLKFKRGIARVPAKVLRSQVHPR